MAKKSFKFFVPRPKPRKRPRVHKKRKTNPKSAVLKNITDKADKAANNWTRTKDPKYRKEWYKILKEIPIDKKYNYPI